MGTVIAIVIIAFIGLFILSKCVNSINKSIQKTQGRDRCVACKRRLKAVDGKYAMKCAKCGTTQPSDFDRDLAKSKVALQAGERGLFVSKTAFDDSKRGGPLLLTNRRLVFQPKGHQPREWHLEEITKVLHTPRGFAVDAAGERSEWKTGKRSEWYAKVLQAANDPAIKRLRAQGHSPTPEVVPSSDSAPPPTHQSAIQVPVAPPASTPTPPPPGTPAGWIADPLGEYEHRYWDGSRWTEHVSTAGEQTTAFL